MKALEEKISTVIKTVKNAEPGGIAHIEVKHSYDCPALKTKRLADCNCKPDIKRMGEC